jgi:hypothetical protein
MCSRLSSVPLTTEKMTMILTGPLASRNRDERNQAPDCNGTSYRRILAGSGWMPFQSVKGYTLADAWARKA